MPSFYKMGMRNGKPAMMEGEMEAVSKEEQEKQARDARAINLRTNSSHFLKSSSVTDSFLERLKQFPAELGAIEIFRRYRHVSDDSMKNTPEKIFNNDEKKRLIIEYLEGKERGEEGLPGTVDEYLIERGVATAEQEGYDKNGFIMGNVAPAAAAAAKVPSWVNRLSRPKGTKGKTGGKRKNKNKKTRRKNRK
jgi:hypothetical protein